MDFLTTLISVGLLVALAAPGFILKKLKVLPDNSVNVLVAVLLFVAQPFLTFSSFLKKSYSPDILWNILAVAVFAVLSHIVILALASIVFKPFKDENRKRISIISSYMGNCSFLGIPLLQALFPSNPEPIMYAAVYSIIFNLFSWTVTIFILTKDRSYISVKKAVLNPPTLAILLALPLFFFSVELPAPLMTTLDFLGNMTAPVSMMILGIRLAETKFKELFNNTEIYLVSLIKLIVFPLLTFAVLILLKQPLSLDPTLITTLYILSSMPVAAAVLAMSEKFTPDSSLAVKNMVLTTFLCVITIPLLMMLTIFV